MSSRRVDTLAVINRVSGLRGGRAALIQSYQNLVSVTTPSGTTTRTPDGFLDHAIPTNTSPTPHQALDHQVTSGGSLPSSPPLYHGDSPVTIHDAALQGESSLIPGATPAAGLSTAPGPIVHPDVIPNTKGTPMIEFNQAVNYVNKIKRRFASDPDTYKQFLEILQAYQKKQHPITKVYQRVDVLFNNQRDLLEDFRNFLPDNGAAEDTENVPVRTRGSHRRALFSMVAHRRAQANRRRDSKKGPKNK